MVAVLNLALPYFGLIFIGYASGKAKGLPRAGLGLDELLPALCLSAGFDVHDHVKDAV
jgi:hypothetical protein